MPDTSQSSWDAAFSQETVNDLREWCKSMADKTPSTMPKAEMLHGLADLLMLVTKNADLDDADMFAIAHTAFTIATIADSPELTARETMEQVHEKVVQLTQSETQ